MFEDFIEENEYSYKEINKAIGYKPRATTPRGILPIPKGEHEAVMLRINLRKNLYDEEYDPGSPVLHYIGEGLPRHGDQKRTHGNKLLAESQDKDIYLFVHAKNQKTGFWTYNGVWRLLDYNARFPSNKTTPWGTVQKVFKFRLVKRGVEDPLQASRSAESDEVKTPRVVTDSQIALQLRDEYDNRCQICGNTISIPNKGNYSEVHYLRPREAPHLGPDERGNIMVLCPNHNSEMNFGVFYVDSTTKKIIHHNIASSHHESPIRLNEDHQISKEYLDYHKEEFCQEWHTHAMRSSLVEAKALKALIDRGEDDKVEFKSSFSYNKYTHEADENLEMAVFKAIGGFMNSDGGQLLIGVTDEGEIYGLENDFDLLRGPRAKSLMQIRDKFKRRLSNRMRSIGFKEAHLKLYKLRFVNVESHDVCHIDVKTAPIPVYLPKDGAKYLPVRLDGETRLYGLEEALEYFKTHRPDLL
ncbi:MAG: RNA-binding domain-containing protein [Candidatus Thorarchaeota archaeon]